MSESQGVTFGQRLNVTGHHIDQVAEAQWTEDQRLVVVLAKETKAQAFVLAADKVDQIRDGFVMVFVVHGDTVRNLLFFFAEIQAFFNAGEAAFNSVEAA